LLLIIIVILLYPRPVSEPEVTPVVPAAPPVSEEERGDAARDIIARLDEPDQTQDSDASPGMDAIESRNEPLTTDESGSSEAAAGYAEAFAEAEEFRAEGRFADAQLLYFFAARGGHAPAAFTLATFYDPNHFSADAGLMDKPDPYQAYKWYKQSLEQNYAGAEMRLAELRTWAENAAGNGDVAAEQLLLVWE
jgi:TPR repeat protein